MVNAPADWQVTGRLKNARLCSWLFCKAIGVNSSGSSYPHGLIFVIMDAVRGGLCCTNPAGDSCRELVVVAGVHEQTIITYLQDDELACLQRGAEAPRVSPADLVFDPPVNWHATRRQEGQVADLQSDACRSRLA